MRTTIIGAAVLIVLMIAIGWLLTMLPKTAEENANAACRVDWTKCTDNEQLVNNYSKWSDVRSECKKQANAQAKYGTPIWPSSAFLDYFGGLDYPRLPGIVVAIEPDAQFSNGFGAMVHSRVECKYNLQEKEVIRVEISERQLHLPFQPQSRMKSPN